MTPLKPCPTIRLQVSFSELHTPVGQSMAGPPTVLSRLPARCRVAKHRPTYPTLLAVAVASMTVGWARGSAAQDDGAVRDSGAAYVDSGDASDAASDAHERDGAWDGDLAGAQA